MFSFFKLSFKKLKHSTNINKTENVNCEIYIEYIQIKKAIVYTIAKLTSLITQYSLWVRFSSDQIMLLIRSLSH